MQLISMLAILNDFGPATSSDIRDTAKLKKGSPTSARLFSLYKNKHCTKKKGPDGFIYKITKAGLDHLEKNKHKIETIDELNLRDYSKGTSKSINMPAPKMGKSANSVMEGFAQMFTDQQTLINFLRKIHNESGAMLAQFETETEEG